MRPSLIAVVVLLSALGASAEHPSAPQLLPERTLAVARIRNVPDSIEKFKQTAYGRIMQDAEVGPFISKLYQQGQEAYAKIEEQVGVPLERILAIPRGELWVAVVPSRTGGDPAVAILLDANDQMPTVLQLLERGEKLLIENGGTKTQEIVQDVRVAVFTPAGVEAPKLETKKNDDGVQVEVKITGPGAFVQFEKEGALVLASSLELAQELIANWGGKEEKTLASNERFAAVMKRCVTGKEEPSFEWYVDPLEIIKQVARNNFSAQTGLAILPAIGLDGIQAIGGTSTYGTSEFDETFHFHLLLENPRSGVLDLLALTPGEASPEPWVPSDIVSYATLNWDVRKTYEGGVKLYDSFLGEGKAREELKKRIGDVLGVDYESELLAAVEGRFTLTTWIEPPARFNSQCNLIGIKLLDAKAFSATLDKIIAKFPERAEKKSFGTYTYYQGQAARSRRELTPEELQNLRRPEPAIAIVGDYLLLTDSAKFLEHALTTISSDKCLANDLEFKLIMGKITKQAGGNKPGAIVFGRPEEAMRNMYNFATGEGARNQIAKQAEKNDVFKRLDTVLKDQPLPPFAVIAKYLAPSGGVVTQDETGFHYEVFTLKRK